MKKRILCLLAALCITGVCACSCACGETPDGQNDPPATGQTPPGQSATEQTPPHDHVFGEPQTVAPARGVQGCVQHMCTQCTYSYRDEFAGALGEEMPTDKAYSFLFIGNSYTFVNELWTLFKNVAAAEGYANVTVDEVTEGAYTLSSFANPSDKKGQIVEQKLTENHYDFVFLQEQSLRPAVSPRAFFSGTKKLHERIGQTGARDVLYMTWGRHEDSKELAQNGFTYFQLQQKLAAAYEALGEKLGIPVSPVGAAFYKVHEAHPEIELYHPDRSHASIAGTYLAALCHYAAIFGKSPIGTTFIPGGVTEAEAAILQAGAHDAVFGGSVVTDEYKINPDNIPV